MVMQHYLTVDRTIRQAVECRQCAQQTPVAKGLGCRRVNLKTLDTACIGKDAHMQTYTPKSSIIFVIFCDV